MKRLHLMTTVAAAVLLSAGVSVAQTPTGKEGQNHRASQTGQQEHTAQQTTQEQSKKGRSAGEERSPSGERAGKEEPSSKDLGAREDTKGDNAKAGEANTSAQSKAKENEQAGDAEHMNKAHNGVSDEKRAPSTHSTASEPEGKRKLNEGAAANANKAGDREQSETKSENNRAAQENRTGAGTRSGTEQAGTHNVNAHEEMRGGNLSVEQRNKIRETVLAGNNVPRVNDVKFAMNVGAVVPDSIRIVDVPPTLFEIDPAWRGDQYFVVRDEVVIVDQSRRIVATVPVGGETGEIGTETRGRMGAAGTPQMSPDEVRQVQTVLVEKGFFHGPVDGVFGVETRDALIEFQRREGIEATGTLDTRTISSLGVSGKIRANNNPAGAVGSSRLGPEEHNGADFSRPNEAMKRPASETGSNKGGPSNAADEGNRLGASNEANKESQSRTTQPSSARNARTGTEENPSAKGEENKKSPNSSSANGDKEKERAAKQREHESER